MLKRGSTQSAAELAKTGSSVILLPSEQKSGLFIVTLENCKKGMGLSLSNTNVVNEIKQKTAASANSEIRVGDRVNVEIIGKKYQLNHAHISAIGHVVEKKASVRADIGPCPARAQRLRPVVMRIDDIVPRHVGRAPSRASSALARACRASRARGRLKLDRSH